MENNAYFGEILFGNNAGFSGNLAPDFIRMSLEDFEDLEVDSGVPIIVSTIQGEQHREVISVKEQSEINRALLLSKLENENAKIKEDIFISKMNEFGKKAEQLLKYQETGTAYITPH